MFSSSLQTAKIYLNGTLVGNGTCSSNPACRPTNVTRTLNFIGKSNWGDANINAILDEIKIFSSALNQTEVQLEMTNDFYLF